VGGISLLALTGTRVAFGFVTVGRPLQIQVQRLDAGLPLPAYAHDGDAGADIVAATDVSLAPGERALVPTGIAISLPPGYAAFVHPRSGLAIKAGVGLVNGPGTIDAGYRGEIKVIVINHDPTHTVQLRRGDRIAQLVVQRVERAEFVEASSLSESERGLGGHGSTGGSAALLARSAHGSGDGSPAGSMDAAVADATARVEE
jgi:dUTP pyrophosphatase